MKKTLTSVLLILNTLVAFINAQTTSWALPFKPNSTSNNVNVTDVEFDANGNVFATGSFRGIVNFNFNGTATNVTSAGGHDIFLAKYNSSGILQWLKTIGGTADDASVALDIRGTSIVIAGTFVSTNVDFDPGTGTNVLSSSGLTDVFVAKFDDAGNHIWAKRSGGTQGELATDVGFDANLNVFIAGSFTTINDFFSNTNTINTGGARDAFLCKLDANGTYVSVKVIGGAGTDVSNKLTVYGNNWCLLCVDIGYSATSSAFDPGSGTASMTFSGTSGTNGIVVGWNDLGAFLSSTLHFNGNSHMVKMLAQNNENIGIGTFSGTMDIDPTTGVSNVTAVGARDMFMVQTGFATGGSFIAYGIANGIGASDAVYPTNAVMKVGNNYQTDLYITGYANGSINFGGTSVADIQGTTAGDCSFEVKYNHDFATNNDFQLLYAHRNASAAGVPSANENSCGNGIALNTTTEDVIIGGYYSSASTSPKPVVFNPGNLSVTQSFSSASMGYVQYIKACSVPTVSTVSNSRCGTGSLTLTSNTTNGTIKWYSSPTATLSLATGTLFTTPSITNTTTYYVEGTDNGCITPTRVAVTATVKTVPSTTASANAYSFCSGSNVTLTASGATTYSWNTNSTATSFTVSPSVITIYTVTGTTNGCSKTDTVKITPKATPTVITSSSPNVASCSGTTFTLQASGANTYSWVTGPATQIYTVVPTTNKTYTVMGISTNGCSKTATVAVTIKVASVTATNPDFRCGPGTVVLGASTVAGTLEWYSASTGGSPLFSGASYTTPSISGTTTYYVGVNNNGCISAVRAAVTATVKTIPTIPSSANNFVRCGTGTISISASPGSLGTIFWYSSPTSSSPISSNGSYVTPSLTNTATYYAATASGGCYSTRLAVNASIENGVPSNASINTTPGANLTICSNNTTTLSAIGNPTTNIIKWYSAPTGTTSLSTGRNFTTPSLTTNTTYYAESNNSCGGTTQRTAITVSVGASPVPPSNTTVLDDQIICSGNTTTVSATSSGSVKWYTALTGGTLLTTNTSYVTPVLTANTTYYAENLSSCGTSTRIAVTVTVNSLPNVTVNSGTVCAGSSFTIIPSGATSYTFSSGNDVVTPLSLESFTIIGSNANGCTKTAISTVTVYILPNITVNSGAICIGKSFTLTPSGAISYTYSNGNATVNPTITTNYTVTGTNSSGCKNSAVSYVTVNDLPVITVNSGEICNGDVFEMNPSGALSYTYSNGSYSVSPTSSANYTVFGTDLNGCKNTAVSNVTVNTLPIVSLSPITSPLCTNSSAVNLVGIPSGGTYVGSGVTGNSFDPATSGAGTFTVNYYFTDMNSCVGSASEVVIVDICTNLQSINNENPSVSVYPNPNNGEFSISISSKGKYEIMNSIGQKVETIDVQENNQTTIINGLPQGIYYVVGKLVKAKIIVTK